jgi:sugar lactone lactonase YvrE
MKKILLLALTILLAVSGQKAYAQSDVQPTNSMPNPYETIKDWAKMPEGRTWGATSAVAVDKDGKSIWVAERCQAQTFPNSCLDRSTGRMSNLPSILKFDESGKLVKSFGEGMIVFPHGIFVDRNGNVWVTDGQDNSPLATGAGPPPAPRGDERVPPTKGHQVFKFSPEGKLLLALGKPGGATEPDYFYQPNAVLVAPNGDIFVSEGHGGKNNRILKFSQDGKLIKTWGKTGIGPGEFSTPHTLAMDSRGRLFVGDRGNNRIEIFDQDGKYLTEWKQFSRPSGVYIDKNDNIYVADSESGSVARDRTGWKRGIRVGSAKDGSLKYFIPDPNENATGTSAAEGVAADARANVYGAEVGPRTLKRYIKKK